MLLLVFVQRTGDEPVHKSSQQLGRRPVQICGVVCCAVRSQVRGSLRATAGFGSGRE